MPALKKNSVLLFVLFTLTSIQAYSAIKPPYYDQCFKFFLASSKYSAAQISSYCNKNASYSFYEATQDWRAKLPVWHDIYLSGGNSDIIYVDVRPSYLPVAMSDKFETSMNNVLLNLQSLPDFRTVNILTMAAQHDVISKKMKLDTDQLSFESMLTLVEAIRTQIENSDLSSLDSNDPEFESQKLQLYTCAANLYNFKIATLTKESKAEGDPGTLDSLREVKQSKHFGRYFSPADAFTACGAAGPTLIQCGMDTYNDQDEPKRFSFKSLLEICEREFEIPGNISEYIKIENRTVVTKTTEGSRYTSNPLPAPAGNVASPSKTTPTTSIPVSSAAKPTQHNASAQKNEFETLWLQLSKSDSKSLSSVQIVKQLLSLLNKEWAKVSAQKPNVYSERNRQLVPYFEFLRSQINTLPAEQMVNLKSDLLNNFDDLFGKLERSSPLNSTAINSRNTARQYIKGVIEKL